MKKVLTCGCATILTLILMTGFSFASDQDRTRSQDRKKDGSCRYYSAQQESLPTLAADRDRTRSRDRKKDGSCQYSSLRQDGSLMLAAAQTRTRTQDRTRDRIQRRDRSGR
jgi:hypothetical protein